MSALLAVVSHDRRLQVPAEELEALIRAHREIRGPSTAHVASADGWARVACIGEPELDRRSGDGRGWLLAIGAVHTAPSPADRIEELDGQFAAAVHDPEHDRLEIGNDPFGMQPLYVAERSGRTYVATSSLVLARHLRCDPDPLGARLFLRSGNQFGPATHWHGVKRLDPGTLLNFDSGRPAHRTYWRAEVDERVRGMGFRQTVDHCAEVVVATVANRLRSRPCLTADLTGGYDSRLVTAVLNAGALRFEAVTSGEQETVDVRLAREVADAGRFGWRQQRLPERWELGPDQLAEAIGWGDGALEALQLSEVLWRQAERSETCGTLVAGGGGEHFGPYPWLQEFAQAGRSRTVHYDRLMRMRVLPPSDLSMVRDASTSDVEEYVRSSLSRRAEPYSDQPNTTQLDAIYAYKSTGHFGAYRSASAAHLRAEIPCYYREVFSAAFSAHHRWRNAHRLHRALIERLQPRMAAVATERGGPAEVLRPSNALRFSPYYLRLGATAVRKVLRRPAPATRPSDQVQAGYLGAVRRLRADGVLTPGSMRSGALYEPRALEAFVARSEAPDFTGWSMLGRIATVELTLREVDGASF
jgi:hypothetical protein